MGDSRNEKGYEMAPTSDPEKGAAADGEVQVRQSEWSGLGKEELLRVADTPTWNWTRNILLILFWVGWVAMLIAAIVIVVKVPRCPEVEWWEKSVYYQAFPRSIKDNSTDGVGDFQGLTESLDHLENIGAKVLYLNSIFKGPNGTQSVDVGHEITDFMDVDMSLGTLKDFDALVSAAAEKEIKVILEFVPNHSSDKHPWFEESKKSKDNEYADFYVWADGVNGGPPNDWKNAYGDPAWTLVAERDQYYYHYYQEQQPDFNFNNETLRMEIEKILAFWLVDHNVDGYVFGNVEYLLEPPITTVGNRRRRQAGTTGVSGDATKIGTTGPVAESEPATTAPAGSAEPEPEPEPTMPSKDMPAQYDFLGKNSEIQNELFGLLKQWRKLLNTHSYLGKYRLMVAQSEGRLNEVAQLYGVNGTYLADLALNTGFLDTFDGDISGESLATNVGYWMQAKANAGNEKRWNTWMLGCHDRSRIASRAGEDKVDALNFMLLTLPGAPFLYYGEEIGMKDVDVPANMKQDMAPLAESRDKYRTPLPWNNQTNAGFTCENCTAYLPLPWDASTNNVYTQKMKELSTMNIIKELAALHSEPSLVAGTYTEIVSDANVFAYLRAFADWPRYLVVINVGADATHDFATLGSEYKIPSEGKVILSTSGEKRSGMLKKDGKRKGNKESLSSIKTKGGEALLIKLKH